MEYLEKVLWSVHGRSGFTPAGSIAVLTWDTLYHYQAVTGIRLTREEADALIELDAALISDEIERSKKKESPTTSTEDDEKEDG